MVHFVLWNCAVKLEFYQTIEVYILVKHLTPYSLVSAELHAIALSCRPMPNKCIPVRFFSPHVIADTQSDILNVGIYIRIIII